MTRILIADDDETYLTALQKGLMSVGYDVTCVGSGAAAIEALQQRTDAFDVVILDVMMNDGGAISGLHQIKGLAPDLPVIVTSGREEVLTSPLFQRGLRLADERVPKSAGLKKIDGVIRKCLASRAS